MRKTNEIKPILHPLSDLTKEIEHNGEKFVPTEKLDHILTIYDNSVILELRDYKRIDLIKYPLDIIQKLYEWHFDIHNLIENGLAIDINTLNKERGI